MLHAQENVDFMGQVQYDVRSNDVWGYTDADGNEYAIIGLLNGTSIVDVTDPVSPIEVAFVPGPESIWRDIKTWEHYAYVSNETDSGILIIDLIDLPESVMHKYHQQDGLKTVHNLWVDENGFLYALGSNLYGGGAVFIDVNTDPWNPENVGGYDLVYCHDAFVRGDTMYTAELYAGRFGVVDISDKTNPVVLATHPTPSLFTHNVWLSNDGDFLFTTDEVSGAYVAAYDISDLSDIRETDRFRSSPGSGVIPHNVHWKNNFLITSYYRDGVSVVDATKPDNLVQTGYFDTSPFPPEGAFNGCWGAYPFFNSGTLLASDIEEGLFVLEPTYARAAYLEGSVVDAADNFPLISTLIEIMATPENTYTDLSGNFKTGTLEGIYDIRISKPGCITAIYPDVELISAETYILDAALTCTLSANITVVPETIDLQVYPTVSSATFQLQFALPQNITQAEAVITNLQGVVTDRIAISSADTQLQLQTVSAPGIYFVHIEAPELRSRTLQILKL